MSLKMKLISAISAFTLVLGLLIMGVFAVNQAQVDMGGSITFNADDVYARVTGSVANAQVAPTGLDVTYSAYETVGDPSAWEELDLLFDSQGTPVVIAITVENLSTERSLTVNLTDTISSSTPNLNKSLQRDSNTYSSGTNITLDPKDNGTSTTTFTITLSVADRNQSLTNAQFDYDLNLYDESAVPEVVTYPVFEFELIEGSTNEIEITSYPTTSYQEEISPITSFTLNYSGSDIIGDNENGDLAFNILNLGSFYYTVQGEERKYCANIMEFQNVMATLTFPVYIVPQYTLSLSEYSVDNVQMVSGFIQAIEALANSESIDTSGNILLTTGNGAYNNSEININDNDFQNFSSIINSGNVENIQALFPLTIKMASPINSIEKVITIPSTFSINRTPVTSFTVNEDGTSDISGDNEYGKVAMYALGLGEFYYTPQGGERTYCANIMEFQNVMATITPPVYFEPQYTLSIGEYSKDNYSLFNEYLIGLGDLTTKRYTNGDFYFTTADGQYNNTLVNIADVISLRYLGQEELQPMFPMQLNLASTLAAPVYVEGDDYTVVGFADGTRETGGSSAYWYTGAFSNDLDTTTIYIPKTVRYIGDYTFAVGNWNGQGDRDKQLTNIVFEDGSQLERIGDGAFSNCVSLNSINLPSSLTSIGTDAFRGCSGLTSISLPSSLTSIGYYAFSYCTNLTEVIIDSEYVYTNATSTSACGSLFDNSLITTVKVLTSLVEVGENSYIVTNFPNVTNEVIDGKNYTVYSKS